MATSDEDIRAAFNARICPKGGLQSRPSTNEHDPPPPPPPPSQSPATSPAQSPPPPGTESFSQQQMHDELRRVLDEVQQALYFAGTHRAGAFPSVVMAQGSLSIHHFHKFFGKLFNVERDELSSKKWRSNISFETAR